MDDIKTPIEPARPAKPLISPEEMEQRRTHVRVAVADNRIEGIETSTTTQAILASYVRGEIEASDLVTAYKKTEGAALARGPRPVNIRMPA